MNHIPASLQKQLKACRTLPSVPAVVLEVLDLCQQDDVPIPKVAKILARDPALAAKVLRVANSAWYGLRSEVTTLDRALALLGINATLTLALSFSFVRGLRGTARAHFDHQRYWRRSTIAAVSAKVLGGYDSDATRDELFVAGLLQDIGMLVLNEAIPEIYCPILSEAGASHRKLVETERARLGTDHAAIGEWLLKSWNLPEKLRSAVGGSHQTDREGTARFVSSVALAGRVAEIWLGPDNAAAAADAREASVRLLQLPGARFDKMLGQIATELPEVTANLEVDLGGEEAINRLLDQAREALVMLTLQAQQQATKFRQQSQSDPLTGLYNRAYLDEVLADQFLQSLRSGEPLSVVFIDLDHFKSINDTRGHYVGDQVLVSVAGVLKTTLRSPDVVARYGGEEFVCVLPNTPEPAAALVAERLRATVAARSHDAGAGASVTVTISAGCATLSSRRKFRESRDLVEAADRCLYLAKSAGRNRVVTLETLDVPESAGAA